MLLIGGYLAKVIEKGWFKTGVSSAGEKESITIFAQYRRSLVIRIRVDAGWELFRVPLSGNH